MSSTTKTLQLLTHFTPARPEIGLSQLCRLAQRDKATTYRYLQALEDAGFIEKNLVTKQYRLGPAVLQLAQTREITVPRKAGAEAALADLADATGETAHVTVLSGTTMYALTACESLKHSTRTIVDIQTFPLHATASGLCALAFGPPDLLRTAHANLTAYTANTTTTETDLKQIVETARNTGFSHADRSFEAEVYGLATPIYDHSGLFAGAVSVASVATRFDTTLERAIQRHLVDASRQITRAWGGKIPQDVEVAWARTLSHSLVLDPSP